MGTFRFRANAVRRDPTIAALSGGAQGTIAIKGASFAFVLLLLFVLAPTATSAQGPLAPLEPLVLPEWAGDAAADSFDLWFVELGSAPLADGGSHAGVRADKANFRSAAKDKLAYTERFAYDSLFNGLSVQIQPSDLPKLARIPGVKALYPVFAISVPETMQEIDPNLATALAMTGADIAQSSLGLTGAGVRVAVMDTGIDYDHPDLGGCFGPGCRVEVGWDLVGDAFNADSTSPTYNPNPVPDPDPDDCQGHGTHVSGIVGASGAVTGVAPGVTFGAYRVFGCEGSTFADIMLAAMEMALADDMDVLNMSIGSAFQWPEYPTAAGSDRLVRRGMVVVASFGNSGASGLYSGGAPGVGDKVIGVASFDNSHIRLRAFEVAGQQIGYIPMTGSPLPPTAGTEEVVWIGRACTGDTLLGDPNGKVALIVRGTCTFREKALNAIAAGATAVIVYNSSPGIFSGTVGSPPLGTPVMGISQADGTFIRAQTPPVFLTWTGVLGVFPNPTGGLISSFSSYGLSPDLALKPDIGAPGGSIYATYPLEKGAYATLSGTSMSSPHVAGAVALLLEARPHTPAAAVRSILQNSADPAPWWGNPGLGFLDNVHRQGAGMLDIDDAILAMTTIEPGKLSLGESEMGPAVHTLTLRNRGASPVTFDLLHAPALATGSNTFSPSFFASFATVAWSAPSVTVPAGGTATVTATITAPSSPVRGQYGGYLVFAQTGEGPVYRVPYAGFIGDYQSIQVLVPTSNGFPWLAKRVGSSYTNQPGGATYTMAGGDIPYILVHLDHQVRKLRMEVFDANTGKAWHRALELDHVGRNSAATSFFAFSWDGFTTSGKKTYEVPNGMYVIKLSVQKALGDADNPAHWESWTSPVITIARP